MPDNKTITINGRQYDAVTGLPVKKEASAPKASGKEAPKPSKPVSRPTTSAKTVHTPPQRSTTLRRAAIKKPATVVAKHPTRGRSMDIARSSRIQKFAPHPVVKEPTKPATPDRPARPHPMAVRALKKNEVKKPVVAPKPASSKEVKDAAIAKALSTPAKKEKKKRTLSPWKRRFIIIGLCVLAVFGIAWAVYRFIPSVSVSIAATQAGVRASYPEYVPDGFSLHHPVTYNEGEVVLVFTSNTNDDSYTITQTKSSWDSSAVLDNVVRKAVGENYVTTTERGLTIYSYGTNASWVNAGVLYAIESNAHLSTEQIRRIATSL